MTDKTQDPFCDKTQNRHATLAGAKPNTKHLNWYGFEGSDEGDGGGGEMMVDLVVGVGWMRSGGGVTAGVMMVLVVRGRRQVAGKMAGAAPDLEREEMEAMSK
ncbi:hypothetical protein Tco_1056753 [Tanacetum coccineum]|uniref:Uncharacterized protein n=1 Tax=Tanacetum coccineum TaxID=301880 RepID=A0ABQ5H3L3_9ASTR